MILQDCSHHQGECPTPESLAKFRALMAAQEEAKKK